MNRCLHRLGPPDEVVNGWDQIKPWLNQQAKEVQRQDQINKIRNLSTQLKNAKAKVQKLQAAYDAEVAKADWDWNKD